jgi:hypothetical protein
MQDGTESREPLERQGSWAFQLALCLLGPLFFLSYILSVLSPLPLLYLHAGTANTPKGRFWAATALVVGLALCGSIKGWAGGIGFFLLAAVPAIVLGELFLRRKGPERAVFGAFLAILLGAAFLVGLAKLQGIDLLAVGRATLDSQVQMVAQSLLARNPQDIPPETREDLIKISENPALLYPELPGILLMGLLLLCILPSLAMIRWNPKGFLRRSGISRDFLRKWRAPDWLVWVALGTGAFHIFELEYLTPIAKNLLKPVLLIYFLQGMSILAYFLDSFRLRGPIRVLLYGMGTIF